VIRLSVFSVPLALTLLVLSHPAGAAVQRSFVSTGGDDANAATSCARSSPCRSLTTALTVTNSGGEIIALDSGGYGALAIDKSIAIVGAPGVYVGIGVASGNGITIATPGIKVALRGLSINGLGGARGIELTNADSLIIEQCVFSNFTHAGLYVAAGAKVGIMDSVFRGNASGAIFEWGSRASISNTRFLQNSGYGLIAMSQGSNTSTRVYLDRVDASSNGLGLFAASYGGANTVLGVINSSVTENSSSGVLAYSSGGYVQASISNSQISGNVEGLMARGSGANLVSTGNTIARNASGFYQFESAVIESASDNVVRNNSTPSFGTITSILKM